MNTHIKLIGFIGRAGSGKNEAAKQLESILEERGLQCRQLAFASPLKHLCADLFGFAEGVPHSAFYGTYEEKNQDIPELGMSGREILQRTGEFFRSLSSSIWCKYLISSAFMCNDKFDVAVVTDVRYEDEAAAIRDAGGLLIRIRRKEVDELEVTCGIPGHASETEQQNIKEDACIDNDLSVLHLRKELQKVIDI